MTAALVQSVQRLDGDHVSARDWNGEVAEIIVAVAHDERGTVGA